jgi:hypothetical protein
MRVSSLMILALVAVASCSMPTVSYPDDFENTLLTIDSVTAPATAKAGEPVTLTVSYRGAECGPSPDIYQTTAKNDDGLTVVAVEMIVSRHWGTKLKSSDCTQPGSGEVSFTPKSPGEYLFQPIQLENGQLTKPDRGCRVTVQ